MTTTPSNEAPASSSTIRRTLRRAALAMFLGAAAIAPATSPIASATPLRATTLPPTRASREHAIPPSVLAQNEDGGDTSPDKGASPDQVDKYVAVYRAMQRNHSMTVEQAAAAQGLTVEAFRDLERRVAGDERTRDEARRALAAPAQSATPTATPKARR